MKELAKIDVKNVRSQFRELLEPDSCREATNCATKILDTIYEKADLPKVVSKNCSHLSLIERHKLLQLLQNYKELFNGTLSDW